MSSGTSGIARGALNEGMYLDFVVQEDEIKEEDMLMSTGNDLFPPALIIGSVDHIEANATQMFKKVRIRPAIKDVQLGRVLVIKDDDMRKWLFLVLFLMAILFDGIIFRHFSVLGKVLTIIFLVVMLLCYKVGLQSLILE